MRTSNKIAGLKQTYSLKVPLLSILPFSYKYIFQVDWFLPVKTINCLKAFCKKKKEKETKANQIIQNMKSLHIKIILKDSLTKIYKNMSQIFKERNKLITSIENEK